jgi:hypothetical protein
MSPSPSPVRQAFLDRVLTLRRVRGFSIAIFVVNALLYALVVARGRFPLDAQGTVILPDFIGHLTGGVLALRGDLAHLYDVAAQSAVQRAITHDASFLDLFISPPLVASLYVPFACCSYAVAAAAWTIVTALLLFLSARVLRDLTPSIPREQRRVLLVATLASQPVIHLLGSGQDTGISLLLWSCGVMLALRRRDAAAGFVMSLGLFKPQLFMLPPLVFLSLRRKRALGAWTVGAIVQGALTSVVFGARGLRGWWGILHSREYLVLLRADRGMRMTSILPFVESVFPRGIGAVEIAAKGLGVAASLALVIATLWRSFPGRPDDPRGPLDERGVWALACLATLLASPHLFYYDMTLLALPVALLVEIRTTLGSGEKRALLAIALLTWTAAVRAGLEGAAWPLSTIAASWTAIPTFYLWRAMPTRAPIASRQGPRHANG